MNSFSFSRRVAPWVLCSAMLGASAIAAPTPSAPSAQLPSKSVYQLAAPFTDQNGKTFTLAQRRGHPVLVSMFYNSCEFVCPMLIDTMRLTEQGLSESERAALSMLLITFDPARDSVATLKKVADQRTLDQSRWTLARTDASSSRKVAATLDIQYRQLSNGEFNHSTVLVLLDGEGRIVGRTKKMGALDPAFVELIKKTVAGS